MIDAPPLPPSIDFPFGSTVFTIPADCMSGKHLAKLRESIRVRDLDKAQDLFERAETMRNKRAADEMRNAARELISHEPGLFELMRSMNDPGVMQGFLQSVLGCEAGQADELCESYPHWPVLVEMIRRASGIEDELKNLNSRHPRAGETPSQA